MCQTLLLTSLIVFVTLSSAIGQDLHDWKGKAGHTTKAAFLKVDEATRKVTILIPKEIEFDKLDDESIALARRLAAANNKAKEVPSIFDEVEPNMNFLREKYDELIRFKSNADFPKWGLSIGGPYNEWMQSVKEAYNRQQVPFDKSTGAGELLSLGLEYVRSKGKETKVTAFFKEEIEKILSGKPGPEWPSEKNPRNTFAEFQFIDCDGFPDVHAFSTLEQISSYWKLQDHKTTYSPQERRSLGIELLETKTKVKVHSRIPFQSTFIFEVTPLSGRHQGKKLFVIKFDLYESLR